MPAWTTDDLPDLDGKTVLVTGANSGLGLRSAEALAGHGARVLIACRNPDKGEAACDQIAALATGAPPELVPLDLADLSSVEAAAEDVAGRTDRLDGLMNNAGVMALPQRQTADGFEAQFGTNHLGHYALTGRLLPLLLAAPDPRVVTTSSTMHRIGRMRWDDLQHERRYQKWPVYGQSKLANLLFAFDLDRRAKAAGTALRSLAAHPGYASTHLQAAGPEMRGSRFNVRLMGVANRVFAQSDAAGALPQLRALTDPDVSGGEYYGPGGLTEMQGSPVQVKAKRAAYDARRGAAAVGHLGRAHRRDLRLALNRPAQAPTSDSTSEARATPSKITSPSRNATERSTRSTNAGSWVATTTAAPSARTSSSSSNIARRPPASRPTNGSSTSRSENGRTKPSTIEVFWRSPRLNREGRSSTRSISPSRSTTPCRVVVPARAAMEARHVLDVLTDRQVVVQHRVVGQERGRGAGLEAADRPPRDLDVAVARLEEAGEHAQQSRLARAVVADERDRPAGVDGHVERMQRDEVAVVLREPGDLQRGELLVGHDPSSSGVRPMAWSFAVFDASTHHARMSAAKRTHPAHSRTTTPTSSAPVPAISVAVEPSGGFRAMSTGRTPRQATSGGKTVRSTVLVPAISGDAINSCVDLPRHTHEHAHRRAQHGGRGQRHRTDGHHRHVHRAIAHGGHRRRHARDDEHHHGWHGEVADHELTLGEGVPIAEAGVVRLLRERLDGVEGCDPEREPGRDQERRRPVPHPAHRHAGDPGQREQSQHPGDGPAQHAPPAPLPGGEAGTARAAQRADPGPAPRQVGGELAPQHEHGAQVLEGDREAELTDQGGAPLGLLERDVGDAGQPGGHERRRDEDRHDAERVELDRPHPDHPDRGGRSHRHRAGRDVGHRPDQQSPTHQGGEPRGQTATRCHERGTEPEAHDGQREDRAGQDPLEPVLGEAPTGELPGRGTGAGGREDGEAQLAQRGPAQGGSPVDRGHEHVAHVGGLDRQRPAAAARAQPDEEGEGRRDTQPRGSVRAHPLDPGGRQSLVADDGGQHGHHRDDRDPDQVHLVERVDPVDLRNPLSPSRPSKITDDRDGHRERVGHYSSTSSMSVPQIAFGWMNATVVPRDPGLGASSITLWPCALTASSATPQSSTR